MRILAGGASDPGRVRRNNEDSYAILLPPRLLGPLDLLVVVADGMGGHQAGEVASRIIVDRFLAEFGAASDRTIGADIQEDWRREVERAIADANATIFHAAAVDPNLLGMGSTVVAAIVVGDRLYLGNVGDSRAYLINQSTIYQLSVDHSWVAEQVRAGLVDQGDARHHPRKNVLTRAVGTSSDVDVETGVFELVPGDQLLLCTDGLSNLVSDEELAQATEGCPPEESTRRLVELANVRGAPDNVTVVIARALADGST